MLPEPIAVTLQVTGGLEQLGVPYFIGGSLASAIHGISRATMDVDLIADLQPEHVEPFARLLEDAFYVDTEAMRTAIHRRNSFNIVHRDTMIKVDVFIRGTRAYDRSQFSRRVLQSLATEPERSAFVASAEDTVLAKLEWYRMGGEVSERQWRDVQNILKVQADRLDRDYLRQWATQLGILDLLERALAEAH
jgi:arginine deiminase